MYSIPVPLSLSNYLGIDLHIADASSLFLTRLAGISDPEQKRKIIGNTFINVFESEAKVIEERLGVRIEWLLQVCCKMGLYLP